MSATVGTRLRADSGSGIRATIGRCNALARFEQTPVHELVGPFVGGRGSDR